MNSPRETGAYSELSLQLLSTFFSSLATRKRSLSSKINRCKHWLVYFASMRVSNDDTHTHTHTHTHTPAWGWYFHGNAHERIFVEYLLCDWVSGGLWWALGFSNNRTIPPAVAAAASLSLWLWYHSPQYPVWFVAYLHIFCVKQCHQSSIFLQEDKCRQTAVKTRSLLELSFLRAVLHYCKALAAFHTATFVSCHPRVFPIIWTLQQRKIFNSQP